MILNLKMKLLSFLFCFLWKGLGLSLVLFVNQPPLLLAKEFKASKQEIQLAPSSISPAEQIIGVWFSPDKNRKIQFYPTVETNQESKEVIIYKGKVIWLSESAIAKIKKDGGNLKDELHHDVFFLKFNGKVQKWQGNLLTGKKPKKSYPCSLFLDKKNKNNLWISVFFFKKKLRRLEKDRD